jgi:LuxR family maltose regulon positive regulatory protein
VAEPTSAHGIVRFPRARTQPLPRDPLRATKLRVPPVRSDLVARERLNAQLDRAARHTLTLVCAPAGFGKTTLLAGWAGRTRHPVAWVTLDAADNDPARFWEYVIAALRTLLPSLGEQTLALLSAPRPFRLDAAMPTLAAELAAAETAPRDIVLALDDYQQITAEPIHASVRFLLDHLPPRLHLVIASRAVPSLPLARLRVQGALAELDASSLRFTPEESTAYLGRALGGRVADEFAADLCARTEGWAAGLQLAALALRGRTEPAERAAFVRSFVGSHRYIADYLHDEVLAAQPEAVQSFLFATCVLDRLSADLCDYIGERGDARALLEQLERENLFLVALDDERRWYRYHPLFADLLRARLRQDSPERARELHARAAAWHEAHGSREEAIPHALAAGDAEWAGRIVEAAALGVLGRGQWALLRDWLEALPEPLVRSRAGLSLLTAWVLLLAEELDAVEPHLARAEALLDLAEHQGQDAAVADSFARRADLRGFAATARAALAQARFDPAETMRHSEQALHLLSDDNWRMRGLVAGYLGSAHWMRGEAVAAARCLEESARLHERGGTIYFALSALCVLAMVQFELGRLHACARSCRRVLAASALPGRHLAYRVLGAVQREWDDLQTAAHSMQEAVAAADAEGEINARAIATLALGRVRRLLGDRPGAQDALTEVERLAREGAIWPHLAGRAAVARTLANLAWDDLAGPVAWAQACGLHAGDPIAPHDEGDYLVLARVLLAIGDAVGAERAAQGVRTAAEAQGRMCNVVEGLAIEGLALRAGGDTDAALATIDRALALAEPEGIVGIFADEGRPMAALLEEQLKALRDRQRHGRQSAPTTDQTAPAPGAASRSFIERVLGATYRRAQAHETPRQPAQPSGAHEPLCDALSERELDVLRLVAAGRSNQQIAAELVVALSTVKTHLNHIYGKLGVRSRTQALSRARDLGLLTSDLT